MAFIKAVFYLGVFVSIFGQGHSTISCQFDTGLCGWTAVGTSMYSWRTHSGQTMDRTSGPLNDVTCKNFNGQYAYLPGVFSGKDELASLESETVTTLNETTFSFWYFMNGVGIGTLELVQIFQNSTEKGVWLKNGEQKNGWQRAEVTVSPATFKMRFEGSVGLPYGSDLAVDDVILDIERADTDKSHCLRTTTKATTTPSTSTPKPITTQRRTTKIPQTNMPKITVTPVDTSSCKAVNPSDSPLPGTCDFEQGLCGLVVRKNENDTDVTWKISDKRDPYYMTAPIKWDHTYRNGSTHGHYLNFENAASFFKFDKNLNGKNASVETPLLHQTSVCFSFWYIMPTNAANLLVYVTNVDGNTADVWRSNTTTPEWKNQVLSITYNPPFKVVFQTRNIRYMAKVALDDIVVLPDHVKTSTITPKPGQNAPGSRTSEIITELSTKSTNATTIKVMNTGSSTPSITTLINTMYQRPTSPTTISRISPTEPTYTTVGTRRNTSAVTDVKTALVKSFPTSSRTPTEQTSLKFLSTPQQSFTISPEPDKNTKKPITDLSTKTTKQDDIKTTKKAENILGTVDKQKSHKYRNSSTVIGFSVGGLVIVTVIAVVVFYVRQRVRNMRFRKHLEAALKASQNGHTNKGLHVTAHTDIDGLTVLQNGIKENGVKMEDNKAIEEQTNGGIIYANVMNSISVTDTEIGNVNVVDVVTRF